MDNISKELLYDLYINKAMKRKDLANYLQMDELKVKDLLHQYGIKKDKDTIRRSLIKVDIPKDELYDLYIVQNLREEEISKIYNTTKGTIRDKLRYYNIEKSKEQKKLAFQQYSIRTYGTKHPAQSKRVKEKQKETNLKKYGSVSALQNKEVQEKTKHTNLERYGKEYFLGSDRYKEVLQDKYGITNMFQMPKVKEKIKETNLDRYGVENVAKSKKIRMKSVKSSKSAKSEIDGTRFDSSWEAIIYDYCIRNNISIKTQIPLKFEYNGLEHTTYIDFEIDGILFECKASHLLKGIYDYKQKVPIWKKIEVYKQNHIILITDYKDLIPKAESKESNGLKYLNKCPYPLIGVDINLFKNPEFPYVKDKPKCFYKVKVDNKLSPLEAWNDEKLRWRMIKNRIEYVGGFIDNKSILTAMNVTRTCKQPSWFSKNYAKYLIEKYITTNTIYDTFAGWGARCDACKELNKEYVGWDLNKELVEWHQEQGRNINYGDANYIKNDNSNCSIFICPPYQDFEKYFEGQDIKTTQCEWLQKVMNNFPNAKEYLMVCKIVDKDWEKYIVEEKVNKSHFGTNKEYVLLVPRNH